MNNCKVFSKMRYILLLTVAFVAGCASNGQEIPVIPVVADIVAPTVSFTAPVTGQTAVPFDRKVSVAFSEVMDPSTINTTTFTLTGPSLAVVPGAVAVTGRSAVFTPTSPLAAGTSYTATVTTGTKDLAGNALASNYIWSFTTGLTADTIKPTVIATINANGAINVPTNTKVGATFSEVMDSLTISSQSFTLKQGATNVSGVVSYSGMNAVFSPTTILTGNTVYTATITTVAKDLAGNALANDYVWSWTTAAAADTTRPTVVLVNPADIAANVAITSAVHATFNEAMDPSTISTISFHVAGVTGQVSYDAITRIATFTPSGNLAAGTTYTATITTTAADLAGNGLLNDKVWEFTTAAVLIVLPKVDLLSVEPFGAAGGAGVTSCGNTLINGDVSTTAASTLITGLTDANGLGNPYTIAGCPGIVNGKVYTAPPAPGDAASLVIATQAQADAQIAFDATSPASMPGGTTQAAELGALTLAPGVYWTSTSFAITLVDLTLDAKGDPNAFWVFQSESSLTVGTNLKVILTGGAQAKNVYWHVSSAATINAGAQMKGTILAFSGITMETGARLDGRAISLVGGPVTLLNNIINVPAP